MTLLLGYRQLQACHVDLGVSAGCRSVASEQADPKRAVFLFRPSMEWFKKLTTVRLWLGGAHVWAYLPFISCDDFPPVVASLDF